jgi:ubiquitin-activating enzyme E1
MDQQGTSNEQRDSRQLYVVGVGGEQQKGSARVLIVGAWGDWSQNRQEFDSCGYQIRDSSRYEAHHTSGPRWECFLREDASLGVNRAIASLPRLQQLNVSVEVTVHTEPIEAAFFKSLQVVVFTGVLSESKLMEYELYYLESNIGFIVSQADGVFGFVFVNHGTNCTTNNPRAIRSEPFVIKHLTNDDRAILTLTERPTTMSVMDR